jgi:hypothetical protein
MAYQDKITICGPKDDGIYVIAPKHSRGLRT